MLVWNQYPVFKSGQEKLDEYVKKNGMVSKPKPKKNKGDKSKPTTETQTSSTEAGQVRGMGRKTLDIKMGALTCARLGKVDLNAKSREGECEDEDRTPTSKAGSQAVPEPDSPVVPRRLFCSQLLTEEQKTGKVKRTPTPARVEGYHVSSLLKRQQLVAAHFS